MLMFQVLKEITKGFKLFLVHKASSVLTQCFAVTVSGVDRELSKQQVLVNNSE